MASSRGCLFLTIPLSVMHREDGNEDRLKCVSLSGYTVGYGCGSAWCITDVYRAASAGRGRERLARGSSCLMDTSSSNQQYMAWLCETPLCVFSFSSHSHHLHLPSLVTAGKLQTNPTLPKRRPGELKWLEGLSLSLFLNVLETRAANLRLVRRGSHWRERLCA